MNVGERLVWKFIDRQVFRKAIMHLLTCHPHSITVIQDTMEIKGSQMAMNCIRELVRPDGYEA